MQETTIESKLTKKDWLKEDAGKPDEHGCAPPQTAASIGGTSSRISCDLFERPLTMVLLQMLYQSRLSMVPTA